MGENHGKIFIMIFKLSDTSIFFFFFFGGGGGGVFLAYICIHQECIYSDNTLYTNET